MNKSEIIDIDTEGLNLVLNDINKNMKPENVRKTINDVFGKVGELSKKKQEAIQKAKAADDKVRNQKDYKWYNKKESIVDLQETTREINDALQAQTEAQTLTFQYQESLANMSKLLFQLGVMNIAMNRQVVRELKLSLEGGNSSELDELACQEVQNVIDQLLAQEDLMVKQEKLNDAVIDMRDTVDDHDVRLEDIEKTTKKQETLIQKRIKHEKSQDEAIAAGERKDAEQDAILELQKLKDEEHDRAIASGEKKDEEQDAILV